jgi:hypothetical protein
MEPERWGGNLGMVNTDLLDVHARGIALTLRRAGRRPVGPYEFRVEGGEVLWQCLTLPDLAP